jgi:hypothetical protein
MSIPRFAISCDKSSFMLLHQLESLRIIYHEVTDDFIVQYINGDKSMFKMVRFCCDDTNRQNIEDRLIDIIPTLL